MIPFRIEAPLDTQELSGLYDRRRDLPDHDRSLSPMAIRRTTPRRTHHRSKRSQQPTRLSWRRPARHHQPSSLSQRPRRNRALANSLVRQLERRESLRQAVVPEHVLSRLSRHRLLRRRRSFWRSATLRELVQKAHALGIKVIQDQVANHVGSQHPWVNDPPLPKLVSRHTRASINSTSFRNSVLLSPHSNQHDVRNTLDGWFSDDLPDMNQEEPEVARYEIQNALWWVGMTGIDGIRQDTIQYMPRFFIRDLSTRCTGSIRSCGWLVKCLSATLHTQRSSSVVTKGGTASILSSIRFLILRCGTRR